MKQLILNIVITLTIGAIIITTITSVSKCTREQIRAQYKTDSLYINYGLIRTN